MKKIIVLAVCLVSFSMLTSCGSTAPCGLAKVKKTKLNKLNQIEVHVVADATIE